MEDVLLPMFLGFRVPFLFLTRFISDSSLSFFPSLFSPFPPFVLLLSPLLYVFLDQLPAHHLGDHYYDNIHSSFPEPPEARAQAELAHLNRALVVPEFADSTPLDLFDRDGVLVEAAPHWSWESSRVTVVPRAHYGERDDGIHIPSLDDVGGVICGSV